MFSQLLIVFPAIIAGVAASGYYCESKTICIEEVNDCGVKYGGCFDRCEPETRPRPPPCADTTHEPKPSVPTESCGEHTVCWDGINECGMMYGGCFPDCQPWPTFEPPPCPSSSTWATVTMNATSTVSTNTMGPIFTNTTATATATGSTNTMGPIFTNTTATATSSTNTMGPIFTNTTATASTSATATARPGCKYGGSLIVCVDGIDDCGNAWGGCYDECREPCPEKPTTPCSVTPSPTEPQPTETNCADITVCVDHVNECGIAYGGCHSVCSPTPTYTAPPCPSDNNTEPGCKPVRRE